MAIHHHHRSERLVRLVDQPPQRAVIGFVERLDPRQPVVDRKALAVDLLAVADHARNGAETAGYPHRSRVGEARQPPREHARIEFVRLAVDVDIGARKVDPDHRKTAIAQATDQLVHERILGAAQRGQIDPRRVEEIVRIDRAGVRRVENDRRQPRGWLHDLERRRQFAIKLGHRRALSLESAALEPSLLPEKTSFYEFALSIITIVLPSEKILEPAGTYPGPGKGRS